MKKNKNSMIHEIKEKVKTDKFFFPKDTILELDRYDEYVPTELVCMYVKGGVLFINTYTEQYGVETDKVSEFHTDFVEMFYNIMKFNFAV